MKKKLLFIPLLLATSFGAVACQGSGSKKTQITYGSYIDSGAIELKYGGLKTKVANKENFLISVYNDSKPCECWTTFSSVLDKYVKEFNARIYKISVFEFSRDSDNLGLTIITDSTSPTFAVIKDGKVANEYIYSSDNKPLFTTVDGLKTVIDKITLEPQLMIVDSTYLDKALFEDKKDKVAVMYIWNFCPDCNDCLPRVIYPFIDNVKTLTNKIWIIDLAVNGILLDNNGQYIGTGYVPYVEYLQKHQLSKAGNAIYGYDRGFVPTIQLWEKGELKDATVYFNDAVSKVDNEYKITRSYYTPERVNSLKYTNTVLQDRVISEDELVINESGISWNSEYAAKVHQPILEEFLNYYVK